MSATTIDETTLRDQLNRSDLNAIADIAKKIKLGDTLSLVKATVTVLGATATPDITSAAVKAAAVVTGIQLDTGENLPPIGQVVALQVTASGTAASLGAYIVADAAATAIVPPGGAGVAVGIAKLSDDGKTLTFPNSVTAFTIRYYPQSAVPLTAELPVSAP